jgi:hypothetical protein
MQIHELTKRQRLDEVDVFGPTGIFAVGKQVIQNPKALGSSSALGAAQQSAAQASADKSAQQLAAQGYKVGGRVKPKVTVPQMLQAVQKNPQVQRIVQSLTSQWMPQGESMVERLVAAEQPPAGGASSGVIGNPPRPADAREQILLNQMYQQQAANRQAGATAGAAPAGTAAAPVQPNAEDMLLVNARLQELATEFVEWSDPRLNAGGVTMAQLRNDAGVKKMLEDQLTSVAINSLADPKGTATRDRVEQYMNMAIAAIQTAVQNAQQVSARTRVAQVGAGADQSDEQILTQLQTQGLNMTRDQLERLGQVMQADSGTNTINNTGNRLLNAIARLAGLRIAG